MIDTKLQFERLKDSISKRQLSRFHAWEDISSLKRKFDAVFLISVLHIIPEKKTRRDVLGEIDRLLKPEGFLITDVPQHETYYARRCTANNAYKDGHIMGDRDHVTFYRNYSAAEFDAFIGASIGYKMVHRIGYTKHLIRVWQKPR